MGCVFKIFREYKFLRKLRLIITPPHCNIKAGVLPINKSVAVIIFSVLTISCGKKGDDTSVAFNYAVDTVRIDAAGEILDVGRNLHVSDIDGMFLYNYNRFDHSIEKIDLDGQKFINRFPLEKEGPDGTGSNVSQIQILGRDSVFVSAGNRAGVYTLDGKVLRRYNWSSEEILEGRLEDGEFLAQQLSLPGYSHLAFAVIRNRKEDSFSLKKLDYNQKSISQYQIDPSGNYGQYTLQAAQSALLETKVFLTVNHGDIFVSHEFSNEVYIYSPEEDRIRAVTYESRLTPNRVSVKNTKLETMDELQKAYQSFVEQVRFGIPVWDEANEKYYRLSSSKKFGEVKTEVDFLPEVLENNIYFSVFDKGFNLLQEVPVPELDSESSKYFVRDGKLWVFENLDDELAFVRLSFN